MMSEKIGAQHLRRKAMLYVRQSSPHQVMHNRESGALQYAMTGQLKGRDPPVSVAAILAGQLDHVRDQALLVGTAARDAALGRAMLPQHPASPALRDPEPVADMIDALAAARGA